ncbi:hypothetical protein ACN2XU_01525 [Primorskyibacter sp. 2E107]|uniref:hypothetical protein n=1 Tax=Primorskyibacter sp. 2E107 TaxID=3403458 RepID=UPI003AF96C78
MRDVISRPKCIWCRKDIKAKAAVCTECGMHQSRFYERAKQTLTLATVAGLLFSAATFVLPRVLAEYHARFSAPSVTVLSLRSERDALLRNSGPMVVFVSHVLMRSDAYGVATVVPVNRELAPGESALVDTEGLYSKRVEKSEVLDGWQVSLSAPAPLYEHFDRRDVQPFFFASGDYEYEALLAEQQALAHRLGISVGTTAQAALCTVYFSTRLQGENSAAFDCVLAAGTKGDMDAVRSSIMGATKAPEGDAE